MRTATGWLFCLLGAGVMPGAALPSEPASTAEAPGEPVHLRGYYELDRHPIWRQSDDSPWYVLNKADWANERLLKWGYVPVIHDAKHYYCLIDKGPRTGSHVGERTFMCGDPSTAEWIFNTGIRPTPLLHGTTP